MWSNHTSYKKYSKPILILIFAIKNKFFLLTYTQKTISKGAINNVYKQSVIVKKNKTNFWSQNATIIFYC